MGVREEHGGVFHLVLLTLLFPILLLLDLLLRALLLRLGFPTLSLDLLLLRLAQPPGGQDKENAKRWNKTRIKIPYKIQT